MIQFTRFHREANKITFAVTCEKTIAAEALLVYLAGLMAQQLAGDQYNLSETFYKDMAMALVATSDPHHAQTYQLEIVEIEPGHHEIQFGHYQTQPAAAGSPGSLHTNGSY